METVRVLPGRVCGGIDAPPSKSVAHRALFAAALSDGRSVLRGLRFSQDILATTDCLKALGARFGETPDGLAVTGIYADAKQTEVGSALVWLPCRESGSTLRFVLPLAGALGRSAVLTGAGRLAERPLSVYQETLPEKGLRMVPQTEGRWLPLSVSGGLSAGEYRLRGDVSSQFVTGLLIALSQIAGESVLKITTRLESKPYADLTVDVLSDFGIAVSETKDGYSVCGPQRAVPRGYSIEGDYSQAAFPAACAALAAGGEGLLIRGLRADTHQGDARFLEILTRFGANVRREAGGVRVFRADDLRSDFSVSAADIPDLVPVLAAVGAVAKGTLYITDAARLRIKESDRLRAVHDAFGAAGACVEETEDGLRIIGKPEGLRGGKADSFNDHRIAMALSVLAERTREGIEITGAGAVAKSWPEYWQDLASIGGKYGK